MSIRNKIIMERTNIPIIKPYRNKYVLKTKRDLEILNLCKNTLKFNLSKTDRDLINLIKTQLENDWRKYLLIKLNKLSKKYKR